MSPHTDFIRRNTVLMAPPLVPEVLLHLASEIMPIWRRTEEELARDGVPPPYWAFAWAGGQALARYVLDNPHAVSGKSVLDFGSGSGVIAIAAAKAGAGEVLAADVDSFAAEAIALNAEANGIKIRVTTADLLGTSGWQTILVGDMCYERPLAQRILAWLRAADAEILMGDPGRSYFPRENVVKLASYSIHTTRELEDREIRETGVYRLDGRAL